MGLVRGNDHGLVFFVDFIEFSVKGGWIMDLTHLPGAWTPSLSYTGEVPLWSRPSVPSKRVVGLS